MSIQQSDVILKKGFSIYIISGEKTPNYYKIGFTNNIHRRLKAYHTSIPGKIHVHNIKYFNDIESMKLAEKMIHYALREYRVQNNKEWFSGNIDMFIQKLDDVSNILDELINKNSGFIITKNIKKQQSYCYFLILLYVVFFVYVYKNFILY